MIKANTFPVIAIIADGSPDPEGIRTLEKLDTKIRAEFPYYDVYWAFQGSYMISLIKRGQNTVFKRGVPVENAAALFTRLHESGVKEVFAQCLMMHESSYSKAAAEAPRYDMNIKFGQPFFTVAENRINLINSLEPLFTGSPDTAAVFVGHGVLKDFEQNDCFLKIDRYLREHYLHAYAATLHGPPGNAALDEIKVSGVSNIKFISLMITTSDHVSQEIMGDGAESWKTAAGLPAKMIDTLGDNAVITDYFIRSIRSGLLRPIL